MPILTILDTVAIQNYVFASNRLKESVGASELVKRATKEFVWESLKAIEIKQNISTIDPRGGISLTNDKLEDGAIQAELVYAGGGNTVLLFANLSTAKVFGHSLSKKLLEEAPGIELAIVHFPFEWSDRLGGHKTGVMFDAFKALEKVKRGQSLHRPLAGLGVTAFCESTGQVATTIDESSGNLVSAETAAKLKAVPLAINVLGNGPDGTNYEFPLEFDEMGRSKGESSYIAVVHIDGNGMGKKVEAISKSHPEPENNRGYLDALRDFSQAVQGASRKALDRLEQELLASIRFDDYGNKTVMETVPIIDDKPPFRPLIVGGDDLTFVCDGRLALTLSEFYLEQFELEMNKNGNKYLKDTYACAGIAVVKSHYPFARAYQLAEELTKEAKQRVKDTNTDFSALDWHFAPSGIMADLETIRQREYKLDKETMLIMRPIARSAGHGDWRHWPNFKAMVLGFKGEWRQGQSKIKLLREALRQGADGYKKFVNAYGDDNLPGLESTHSVTDGFINGRAIHFDAIEAMDFFIPLHSRQGDE